MAIEFNLKFAVVDTARDLLHRSPFRPFRLRLHDSAIVEIANPDVMSVTKSGEVVVDDGSMIRTLNPALIASVDRQSVHS